MQGGRAEFDIENTGETWKATIKTGSITLDSFFEVITIKEFIMLIVSPTHFIHPA